MSRHPATAAVRAGIASDAEHGAVVPPLHLSANFAFAGFGNKRRYDYTRSGNPTRDHLGAALAELEHGAGAVVTASGLAALTTVFSLLRHDDLAVLPHDCYGGSWRLAEGWRRQRRCRVLFVDQRDPAALRAALQQRPKLVLCETPSNPLLRVVDIAQLAAAAHAVGALVVADNTFLSPALQQPLRLGVDVVVHSTTKYLNGHSDVVGGAVIAKDAAVLAELQWWANAQGLTGAPFDSFLTLRGLRTLHLRMRQHDANARELAPLLAASPLLRAVHYPGLPSHPDHELARRQQQGFGGMLSFELGDAAAVPRLLDGLRCFTLAESLGGVESLIAHPATMTHASMTPAARRTAGIGDGLLRLSVGIEAVEDLAADLLAALERVAAATQSVPVLPVDGEAAAVHGARHQG